MWILTLPERTTSNKSSAMAWQRSRVAMCANRVARVTYRHLGARMAGANGGTGPLALPKLAIRPKGRRHSSDLSHVSLPTES